MNAKYQNIRKAMKLSLSDRFYFFLFYRMQSKLHGKSTLFVLLKFVEIRRFRTCCTKETSTKEIDIDNFGKSNYWD